MKGMPPQKSVSGLTIPPPPVTLVAPSDVDLRALPGVVGELASFLNYASGAETRTPRDERDSSQLGLDDANRFLKPVASANESPRSHRLSKTEIHEALTKSLEALDLPKSYEMLYHSLEAEDLDTFQAGLALVYSKLITSLTEKGVDGILRNVSLRKLQKFQFSDAPTPLADAKRTLSCPACRS